MFGKHRHIDDGDDPRPCPFCNHPAHKTRSFYTLFSKYVYGCNNPECRLGKSDVKFWYSEWQGVSDLPNIQAEPLETLYRIRDVIIDYRNGKHKKDCTIKTLSAIPSPIIPTIIAAVEMDMNTLALLTLNARINTLTK